MIHHLLLYLLITVFAFKVLRSLILGINGSPITAPDKRIKKSELNKKNIYELRFIC
jgi:hypothetical protein